MKSAYFCF